MLLFPGTKQLWNDYLGRYSPTLDPLGTNLPPLSITDRIRSLFSYSSSSKIETSNRHEIFTKFSRRNNRRTTPWDDIDDDEEEEGDEFDYEKGMARVQLERKREGSDTWDSEVESLASRKKPQRPVNSRHGSSKPAQYGAVSSSDEDQEEGGGHDGGIWTAGKDMDSKSTRSFGALSGSTLVTGLGGGGGRSQVEKATNRGNSNPSSSPTTTTNQNHSAPAVSLRDRHLDRLRATTSKRGSLLGRIFHHSSPSPSSLSPASSSRPEFNPNDYDENKTKNSVPATPSLITAIERVNAAQRQARDQHLQSLELERIDSQATRIDSVGDRRSRRASMDEFWKSVVEKASS